MAASSSFLPFSPYQCIHTSDNRDNDGDSVISLVTALAYCAIVSTSFVASIYLLTPPSVRRLDRNNARQIQWRSFATVTMSAAALVAYPFVFCHHGKIILVEQQSSTSAAAAAAGLYSFLNDIRQSTDAVLAHTALLYLGPLVQQLVQVREYLNNRQNHHYHQQGESTSSSSASSSWSLSAFVQTYYEIYLSGIVTGLLSNRNPTRRNASERWVLLRNLIVAPLTEEIVFRGCIVSALSTTTSLSPAVIVWVAPLFFGMAHFHHAFLRLRLGEHVSHVFLVTAFQFTYTSLFGSYASYAYLRTRSIVAVTASHAFCNGMGLPNFNFLRSSSPLYAHRRLLLSAHVVGLIGFFATINWIPGASS